MIIILLLWSELSFWNKILLCILEFLVYMYNNNIIVIVYIVWYTLET